VERVPSPANASGHGANSWKLGENVDGYAKTVSRDEVGRNVSRQRPARAELWKQVNLGENVDGNAKTVNRGEKRGTCAVNAQRVRNGANSWKLGENVDGNAKSVNRGENVERVP